MGYEMNELNPKCGFYFTPEDIARARANIETFTWAKDTFKKIKQACDEFLQYTDEQIYACVLSMKDQVFAYGIAGCPSCGKPFPGMPEQQKPMFSMIDELPRKTLTCLSCGVLFPNERFDDQGQGIVVNEKGYYLIGMWNFYMAGELLGGVRNHEGFVTKLTYMYMLTGEVVYANRALLILDAFAAISPGTIGPRDFTAFGSDFEIGRLHMLTSIVHRIKLWLAHNVDWLDALPQLDRPSVALQKLGRSGTMRENIEALLQDYMLSEPGGPVYDLRNGHLTNLQNHESDGVRAMLAVGLVLGQEDYCAWGVQAVEAYFYNAIGRDGMYYEGSYGYSLFTGTVFLDIALLAMRASPPSELASFHPFACERFFRFAVENPLEMLCQGHLPSYGDWVRDSATSREPDQSLMAEVYRAALYFYQFTPELHMKEKAESVLLQLYGIMEEQLGSRGVDLFFSHPSDATVQAFQLPRRHTLKGQAGIGILRDANETTVLMRVGQNNTHAHDDVLAYNLYACGKEISADLGYGIYGTNSHFGWSSKAIAHNTVVVNRDEKMRAGQLYKSFSGGEWGLVLETEHLSAFEGCAAELYGIEQYQRFLSVVPFDEGLSYVIDFFTIQGAQTTDYAYHAFHKESVLQIDGAEQQAGNFWTLAGVDAQSKPYFDKPEHSFGERLTTGETFRYLLEDEQERLWSPEPNNGYGFIYDVKQHVPDDAVVQAVWESSDGHTLQWFGLCDAEDRIFTGQCPSIEGTSQHPILIMRSAKAWKQYAAVACAASAQSSPSQVEYILPLESTGDEATALAVKLSTGVTDVWIYSTREQQLSVQTPYGEWWVNGRCAWLRFDPRGEVLAAECIDALEMRFGGVEFTGRARERGQVLKVDVLQQTVWLSGHVPEEAAEQPQYMRVLGPGKERNVLYPLRSVRHDRDRVQVILDDSLILSTGAVIKTEGERLEVSYPIPLGWNSGGNSSMSGKRMIGNLQGLAIIQDIPELKTIQAQVIRPFAEGERFYIVDLAPGDEIEWVYVRGTKPQ